MKFPFTYLEPLNPDTFLCPRKCLPFPSQDITLSLVFPLSPNIYNFTVTNLTIYPVLLSWNMDFFPPLPPKYSLMKVIKPSSHKFQSKIEYCFIIYYFLYICSLTYIQMFLIALPSSQSEYSDSSFFLIPLPWPVSDQLTTKTNTYHFLSLCTEVIVLRKGQKIWRIKKTTSRIMMKLLRMKHKTTERHWDLTDMRKTID